MQTTNLWACMHRNQCQNSWSFLCVHDLQLVGFLPKVLIPWYLCQGILSLAHTCPLNTCRPTPKSLALICPQNTLFEIEMPAHHRAQVETDVKKESVISSDLMKILDMALGQNFVYYKVVEKRNICIWKAFKLLTTMKLSVCVLSHSSGCESQDLDSRPTALT